MRWIIALLTSSLLLLCTPAYSSLQCADLFTVREDGLTISAYPVEIKTDTHIFRVTSGPFIFEGHLMNRILDVTAYLSSPEIGRRSHLHGSTLYEQMIAHFGRDNIEVIKGNWIVGTNQTQFYENLGRNMSPEDAARYTWSGTQAAKHGFSKVEYIQYSMDMQNGAPNALVFFGRP